MAENDWDFEEEAGTLDEEIEKSPLNSRGKPRGKAGRPKGVRNRTKTAIVLQDQTHELYKDIEHMLTPEQQKYYAGAFSGQVPYDALIEDELFARLYSVYATKMLVKGINEDVASQDIANVLAQYRMLVKDIEDMKQKRENAKAKTADESRMVDPTRESTLARFKDLHR